MKVVVETNLDFGWQLKARSNEAGIGDAQQTVNTLFQEGTLELNDTRPTLRMLLKELSRKYSNGRATFIDPATNEVDPDEYLVAVNGKAWEFLPERLETELNDGDRVSVSMWLEVLGGG